MLPIPVRDPRLFFGPPLERPWHGHGWVVSRFLDAQSLLFPEGEKFFVESVQYYRKAVPYLAAEITAFSAQEHMHRKYHSFYNRSLAQEGLPVAFLEKAVGRLFGAIRRFASHKSQLAITVCFEHYTAIISSLSLTDASLWEKADPERARLWQWHALEEIEHRSVAFDVYQGIGGGYFRRCSWMLVLSGLYLAFVAFNLLVLLFADGVLLKVKVWGEGAWRLFGKPGPLRRLFPLYGAFFLPGFHPNHLQVRTLERFIAAFAPSLVRTVSGLALTFRIL